MGEESERGSRGFGQSPLASARAIASASLSAPEARSPRSSCDCSQHPIALPPQRGVRCVLRLYHPCDFDSALVLPVSLSASAHGSASEGFVGKRTAKNREAAASGPRRTSCGRVQGEKQASARGEPRAYPQAHPLATARATSSRPTRASHPTPGCRPTQASRPTPGCRPTPGSRPTPAVAPHQRVAPHQLSPHTNVSPHTSVSPHTRVSPHTSVSPHTKLSPHTSESPHTRLRGLDLCRKRQPAARRSSRRRSRSMADSASRVGPPTPPTATLIAPAPAAATPASATRPRRHLQQRLDLVRLQRRVGLQHQRRRAADHRRRHARARQPQIQPRP